MEVKPISPQEIMDNLPKIIPNVVIESINELLQKKYRGTGSVKIKQDEILNLIIAKSSYKRQRIFDEKWLDFESIYRENGWEVKYDKPGFRESYDAYFEFTPKK